MLGALVPAPRSGLRSSALGSVRSVRASVSVVEAA